MQQKSVFQICFWFAHFVCIYLFLKPNIDSGIPFAHLDKIAHFLVFIGLALLLDYAYSLSTDKKISILVLYGLFIEILQSYFGRESSVSDVVANTLGLIFYFYFIKVKLTDSWFLTETQN